MKLEPVNGSTSVNNKGYSQDDRKLARSPINGLQQAKGFNQNMLSIVLDLEH